jgi:hypothetical protein
MPEALAAQGAQTDQSIDIADECMEVTRKKKSMVLHFNEVNGYCLRRPYRKNLKIVSIIGLSQGALSHLPRLLER